MKYRFVEMLNEYLNTMGRSDLVNSQLDCHSNIQFEMHGFAEINIDLSTDDIIIWCSLDNCNYSHLDAVSASVLKSLLEYPPNNFYPGQPALNIVDDAYVLSAVLKVSALNNIKLFSDSLEEFFERANELNSLIS